MAGISTMGRDDLCYRVACDGRWEPLQRVTGLQSITAPFLQSQGKWACHLKRKTVVRNTCWNASLIRLQKPSFDAFPYSSSLSSLSVFLTCHHTPPTPAHPQPQGRLILSRRTPYLLLLICRLTSNSEKQGFLSSLPQLHSPAEAETFSLVTLLLFSSTLIWSHKTPLQISPKCF